MISETSDVKKLAQQRRLTLIEIYHTVWVESLYNNLYGTSPFYLSLYANGETPSDQKLKMHGDNIYIKGNLHHVHLFFLSYYYFSVC